MHFYYRKVSYNPIIFSTVKLGVVSRPNMKKFNRFTFCIIHGAGIEVSGFLTPLAQAGWNTK